jgi:hypothetical protein
MAGMAEVLVVEHELSGVLATDAAGMQIAIAGTFPLKDGRAAFESGRRPHRSPGKTVLIVRD